MGVAASCQQADSEQLARTWPQQAGPGCSKQLATADGGLRGLLVVARKRTTSREILLWMTPSEAPKALQASECSELLDPMRANCWISAQH